MSHLKCKVMIICVRPKADFFYLNLVQLLFSFFGFFLLLKAELRVFNDAAYRGESVRGDLYQVHAPLLGHAEGLL